MPMLLGGSEQDPLRIRVSLPDDPVPATAAGAVSKPCSSWAFWYAALSLSTAMARHASAPKPGSWKLRESQRVGNVNDQSI